MRTYLRAIVITIAVITLAMGGAGSASALPRAPETPGVEPAAIAVFFGHHCRGGGPYVWQRYVPKKNPNYKPEYYDPLRGPPCRVGVYFGRGRGLVGTRVGDRLYLPPRR